MAKTLSLTKVSTTEVEITIYRNISEQVDSRSQSLLKSKSDFHVSWGVKTKQLVLITILRVGPGRAH